MTEILFIKTSSLGDLIHHMPAVTESRVHFPQARISWLVEEAYLPLARLHPAVDEVIPVAWRRWRRSLGSPQTWREIGAWRRRIGARSYDYVVDTQGLLRTALMGRIVNGARHGYDSASIREPLASRFYDVRHSVSRQLHAIERNRRVTGLSLGYQPQGAPHYGLDRARLRSTAERYAVLLHASARPEKQWPVENWIELGRAIASGGRALMIPWGSDTERARAAHIADKVPQARVADRLPIDEMARLIAGADFVVGGDTGLLHLAAALAVPSVAIFTTTDPGLTGPVGSGPIRIVASDNAAPDVARVGEAVGEILS
jgi:heptosyltransferase-1